MLRSAQPFRKGKGANGGAKSAAGEHQSLAGSIGVVRLRQGLGLALPRGLRLVEEKGLQAKALFIMSLTSRDLSFIWALIQWDRHCQACNFRHVVNYSFEFCRAQGLNGLMGGVQYAVYQSSCKQRKRWNHLKTKLRDDWLWRTGPRESWSSPALYKYLMNCLEAGRASLGVEVIQSVGWVSVMPLMLPHCLSTDKESLQNTSATPSWSHAASHQSHTSKIHTGIYCLQLPGSMSSSRAAPVLCSLLYNAAFASFAEDAAMESLHICHKDKLWLWDCDSKPQCFLLFSITAIRSGLYTVYNCPQLESAQLEAASNSHFCSNNKQENS